MSITLQALNNLKESEAKRLFLQCCTAERWVEEMASARPFLSLEQCLKIAQSVWEALSEADYLQAFEGHPKIGDINSLRSKYSNTKALAAREQSAVEGAQEKTLLALAQGNARYEAQNGFIFIVCATGKSAEEMLAILEERLKNSRQKELGIAAVEQSKITEIRIRKLLEV